MAGGHFVVVVVGANDRPIVFPTPPVVNPFFFFSASDFHDNNNYTAVFLVPLVLSEMKKNPPRARLQ